MDQVTIPAGQTEAIWQAPSYVTYFNVYDTDPDGFSVLCHRNTFTEIECEMDAPVGEAVVVHFRWN